LSAVLLPSGLQFLALAFQWKCQSRQDGLLSQVARVSRGSFLAAPEEVPFAREWFRFEESRVLVAQEKACFEESQVRVAQENLAVSAVGSLVPVVGKLGRVVGHWARFARA
jgi:hypothetical protein